MTRAIALALLVAGCAPVSSEGIYRTSVELTVSSTKSPRAFAICVANALPDVSQMLNDGDHYWLVRTNGGAAIERWDFMAAPTGSTAERRSGQLLPSYGTSKIRECA